MLKFTDAASARDSVAKMRSYGNDFRQSATVGNASVRGGGAHRKNRAIGIGKHVEAQVFADWLWNDCAVATQKPVAESCVTVETTACAGRSLQASAAALGWWQRRARPLVVAGLPLARLTSSIHRKAIVERQTAVHRQFGKANAAPSHRHRCIQPRRARRADRTLQHRLKSRSQKVLSADRQRAAHRARRIGLR